MQVLFIFISYFKRLKIRSSKAPPPNPSTHPKKYVLLISDVCHRLENTQCSPDLTTVAILLLRLTGTYWRSLYIPDTGDVTTCFCLYIPRESSLIYYAMLCKCLAAKCLARSNTTGPSGFYFYFPRTVMSSSFKELQISPKQHLYLCNLNSETTFGQSKTRTKTILLQLDTANTTLIPCRFGSLLTSIVWFSRHSGAPSPTTRVQVPCSHKGKGISSGGERVVEQRCTCRF